MKFIILSVFLFCYAIIPSCAQENVVFQYADSSLPIVPVLIEGQGPYPFLLDTGAAYSQISLSLAEKLKLPLHMDVGRINTVTVVETVSVTNPVKFEILQSGSAHKTSLIVMPALDIETSYMGILGRSNLLNATIKHDADTNEFTISNIETDLGCDLAKPKHRCEAAIEELSIPALLGGHQLNLIVDTGFTSEFEVLLLKSDLTNKLWGHEIDFHAEVDFPSASDKKVRIFSTDDFSFNGNPRCFLNAFIKDPEDFSPTSPKANGLLGWMVLSEVNFTIDFKHKTMSLPESYCPYSTINGSGILDLTVTDDENYLIILETDIGSPLEQGGIVNGIYIDKVITEHGEVVDVFGLEFDEVFERTFLGPIGTEYCLILKGDTSGLRKVCIKNKKYYFTQLP